MENPKTNSHLTTNNESVNDSILQKIYADNYYKTENFVIINSGSKEEAKDIYQEAFLVLWQKINTGQIAMEDKDHINAFLYRVAKNKWIDHLRSKDHSLKTSFNNENLDQYDAIDITDTESEKEWDEKVNRILTWVKKLKPDCRNLLIRFYFNRLSIRTIASQFNIDEASAKNKKYRCMEKLRKMAFDTL